MSKPRLGSFRSGDRSEYLAAFGLSRFAYVHPAPRQEDFGVIDFFCVLIREDERKRLFPEGAFYVQVKSGAAHEITFDGDSLRWISHHMDHPLFLCFVDKEQQQLSLYSTSRMWPALFNRPNANSITFIPDSHGPSGHMEWSSDTPDRVAAQIHLGPPLLRQSLAELETNHALAHEVLAPWLRADSANIARRRVGRIATRCLEGWQTNQPLGDPSAGYAAYTSYFIGPNYSDAERDLVPMLTALAHNYRHHQMTDKAAALGSYLRTLEPFLDDHGRDLACLERR